ncbi:Sulfate transporter permease [Thauera linaloolentis 47Lol = DSM 12138]|uniref:Sulfate transporter permease n=2 Tax=Thauera linaloolentis TaxID=76112 RepID=N6Z6N7_THAL4|nr:Sulfate transporter permease [Thauera linaloolentis 47Lol = DSM 12138]MCM8565311.1 SulP family inorganic anion transporter [Thauera linaloolentis]
MSIPPMPASATPRRPSLAQRWAGYRRTALADDLVAAVIVTILLVPQSLAYAILAGLPPVVGVMASLLPAIAYAAFGSSTTLAVGPVAVLAMMTAQAIGGVAIDHGISPHLAALVLSLEIAAVCLVAALFRLETLAALLGAPVLHGFITGASLVIAIGQLPALLGAPVGGSTVVELGRSIAASEGAAPHLTTATVGLLALLALWVLRQHGSRMLQALGFEARTAQLLARTAPLVVVAASIAWVAGFPQLNEGVALSGRISLGEGMAFPKLWDAPPAVWLDLFAPAALLGLVAYVESLAVAEALAARRGEKISPRRELFGLAAANAAAGVSGGMPVTGGFSRSIINFNANARTRMAGVWTAALLALAIILLGDVLQYLPRAVLAATIIVAVLSMIDLTPFLLAWRYSRAEFALMAAVTALTLFVGIKEALLAGVIAAIGLLLQRTARPHWTEVGRLDGTEIFRNVNRFEVETLPQVLSIRVDESLVFTNSRWISETLSSAMARRPQLRHVVLMMSGVNGIDLTGLEVLMQLDRELRAKGIQLHLSELKGPLRDGLERSEISEWLSGRIFMTQAEAFSTLAAETARQDRDGNGP